MKNVTKPNLNPILTLFLKVTVAVALLIVVVKILITVVPIVLMAAVIAALGLGGFFLYNFIRKRTNFPAGR